MSDQITMPLLPAGPAPGDPLPRLVGRVSSQPRFVIDTAAGRTVILACYGSTRDALGQAVLTLLALWRDRFSDRELPCFGISIDPADEAAGLEDQLPGLRHVHDHDGEISRACRVWRGRGSQPTLDGYQRVWLVIGPDWRIRAVVPMTLPDAGAAALEQAVTHARARDDHWLQPPVMVIPDVLEPEACAALMAHYIEQGGEVTGYMRDINGTTVSVKDDRHKRRSDCHVSDEALRKALQARILRRVVPALRQATGFEATRMERYLIGCYDSADGGHFRPHRDNTTAGTAHRRFAVSVNLNEDFAGGELYFPEFGSQRYKLPPGWAVVFSCSLLHAVTPVTAGRRYAFLPFLYDEAAAELRAASNAQLGEGLRPYRAD